MEREVGDLDCDDLIKNYRASPPARPGGQDDRGVPQGSGKFGSASKKNKAAAANTKPLKAFFPAQPRPMSD